jgi:hypothetical protein
MFELGERRGVDRLDLGDDDIRPVFLDRLSKCLAVEHREHVKGVRELHRRRIGVAIAGDDPATEPLGGDGELAPELAGAEQHQGGKVHGSADSGAAGAPLE